LTHTADSETPASLTNTLPSQIAERDAKIQSGGTDEELRAAYEFLFYAYATDAENNLVQMWDVLQKYEALK